MKAIIEYDLPEEESELKQAINAGSWETVVWCLMNACMKHGEFYKLEEEENTLTLDIVRDKITSLMDEYDLVFSP